MPNFIVSLVILAALSAAAYGLAHLPAIRRTGIPDVAFLLALGVGADFAVHAAGFHPARIFASIAQPNLLSGAATLIILYGGAELTPEVMRTIWRPVLALSTVAVILSAGILGLLTWVLGIAHMSLFAALLLGAVLAGTDPAVLVSILDQVPLNERVREMLIAESALNDPLSAMIATTMIAFMGVHNQHPGAVALSLLHSGMQVVSALGIGLVLGWIARRARAWVPGATIRIIGLFALVYAAAWEFHASPFLAAFLAGLIAQPLDSHGISQRLKLSQRMDRRLLSGLLFADRSYIFLLLGLSFPVQESLRSILLAVSVAVLLVAVARPLSVAGAKLVAGDTVSRHETAFIACNRQTGVIPALFAADLTQLQAPYAAFISLSVTMTVILTSVILLPLFRPLAQTFKLLLGGRSA
ncbi:MAG: cation:proton antiporter domain-containing protein [Bacilli bacterium]